MDDGECQSNWSCGNEAKVEHRGLRMCVGCYNDYLSERVG